eukprot:scaffold14246_cov105-Isochrysis_galbana.AAC.2
MSGPHKRACAREAWGRRALHWSPAPKAGGAHARGLGMVRSPAIHFNGDAGCQQECTARVAPGGAASKGSVAQGRGEINAHLRDVQRPRQDVLELAALPDLKLKEKLERELKHNSLFAARKHVRHIARRGGDGSNLKRAPQAQILQLGGKLGRLGG